jgi:hypothetical protein
LITILDLPIADRVCVCVPWARVEKYIPLATTRVTSAQIDTTIDEIRARIDILF